MSDHHHHKKKKKKRSQRHNHDSDSDMDGGAPPKKSLVDYSTVTDRPMHPAVAPVVALPAQPNAAAAPQNRAMSSQMEAVMRLMTGAAERTIKEKLADSNRPSWEQYKADNSDKLNLEGMDQREMEEYRKQLDREREDRLARGKNHRRDKKKKRHDTATESNSESPADDDDDSFDESRRRRKYRKHKKKKRRKERKRHRDHDSSDDDTSKNESSADDESRRKRRKKKHKKSNSSKRSKSGGGGDNNDNDPDSQGSHYRLSNFFQGSDDE